MTRAQGLKRVFKIDILICAGHGGAVKAIASVEDRALIKKILNHLARRAEPVTLAFRLVARVHPRKALPGLKKLA